MPSNEKMISILTINQFVDEMEKLYEVEGIGYMKVLEKAKEMKKDKQDWDNLMEFTSTLSGGPADPEDIKEYINGVNKYNEELKKENEKLHTKSSELQLSWVSSLIKLKEENDELKEAIKDKNALLLKLGEQEKISNVKTDLIENLFSKMVEEGDIDDGFSISKEYGHKYIDEWNKIYEDIIKDTIKVMNENELDDGVYLKFNGCDCIEFCAKESDEEEEEDSDYSDEDITHHNELDDAPQNDF